MKQIIFYSLTIFTIGIACKKPQASPSSQTVVNPSTTNTSPDLSPPKHSLVKLLRADEPFIKAASLQKPYLMITDSIWNFYFALSISEDTPKDNIYKGQWLDLKEDGSYAKGIYDQTTDNGYYVYDYAKKSIEIRSVQKDSSSEWSLKVDPDALLLIGTAKFNNNPWQIKLLRKSTYPKLGVPLKNER